jgi:LmbE family N-acetylglucosaminyl deacetylase
MCKWLLWMAVAAAATGQPLPLGELPRGKVVLIAQPHHDDHTTDYGMGGFIARLIENGYRGVYIRASNDEKDGRNGYAQNDIINLREARAGLRHLGVDEVVSLNWRNDFMNPIPLNELREQLIFLIRKYKPDVVLGHNPWEHYQKNPDHRNVGRALVEAYWMAGDRNVHPEHFALGVTPHAARHFYGKGRLDWGLGQQSNVAIALNETQQRKKELAIAAHRNVYHNPGAKKAYLAALAGEGKALPELAAVDDNTASDLILHWWMNWISRDIGKRAGVRYAEDYYHMDQWDDVPGLREYLKSAQAASARPQPGRSESVVRVLNTSAQAASARPQRAGYSPLLPGRSESVVRVLNTSAQAAPARGLSVVRGVTTRTSR